MCWAGTRPKMPTQTPLKDQDSNARLRVMNFTGEGFALHCWTVPYLCIWWTEVVHGNVSVQEGFSKELQKVWKYKFLCCWPGPGRAFLAITPSSHTSRRSLAESCPHSQDAQVRVSTSLLMPPLGGKILHLALKRREKKGYWPSSSAASSTKHQKVHLIP